MSDRLLTGSPGVQFGCGGGNTLGLNGFRASECRNIHIWTAKIGLSGLTRIQRNNHARADRPRRPEGRPDMTKIEAPERVWLWRDDPSGNLVASGPDEPYPAGSKAYVPEKAIDAAREEGRRAGLEEAAKYHIRFLMQRTNVPLKKVVASTETIRALIDKPGDAQMEGECETETVAASKN